MIVGDGLIAQALKEYVNQDEILIFASGVSNSRETKVSEFEMEVELLKENILKFPEKLFVYFSTASIYDEEKNYSPYIKHKLSIEKIISENTKKFLIIRVSQLVGKSSNPNTLLNYLVNTIKDNKEFTLWQKTERNLLDIDDFKRIFDEIVRSKLFVNAIINMANPNNVKIEELVQCIEKYLQKKAKYTMKCMGSIYSVNIEKIAPVLTRLNINFNHDYTENLLKKYYS